MADDERERLQRELAAALACTAAVARLADRLATAAETGVVPEGWRDPVDCAEASRAIRRAMTAAARRTSRGPGSWGAFLNGERRGGSAGLN